MKAAFVIVRSVRASLASTGFAAALSWFLVFGGLRAVRELWRGQRRGRRGESDADMLAGLTRIPAGLWARVVQRLLALNAAIWFNWQLGAPVKRSLIAYDH